MKHYVKVIVFILMSISTAAYVYAMSGNKDEIVFTPVEHATMIIESHGNTIYVDPVGDVNLYSQYPRPDIILMTDIHPDHLAPNVISALKKDSTIIIAPQSVASELKYGEVLNNGGKKQFGTVHVEAVPMYNFTEDRLKFHPKGRGNGYVLTINKKRVYISGDTEDTKEMRALTDIDYAFVCMNLPYTMTVEQAASAVLEFKPKVVFPYHYRGKGMFSDLEKFKQLVSKNRDIEVRLLKWYK